MKAYAGIGSRRTPAHILDVMTVLAAELYELGWTLRSGCAEGADTAFEEGAGERAELFLPWTNFNGRHGSQVKREYPQHEAYPIAANFHPAWNKLSAGAQSLHARNVHQILGPDVTLPLPERSRFVICWTPGASGGGGTGQALRIARAYDIPIFDLADSAAFRRVERFLERS